MAAARDVPAFAWLAVLALGVSLVAADEPVALPPELEARARALEAKLMAPCCYTQTIDQHESEAAREMRTELRAWLGEGLSEQQVLERYVARYGARILAVPPGEGFNQLLFSLPFLVVVLLLIGGSVVLWRWYQRGRSTLSRP